MSLGRRTRYIGGFFAFWPVVVARRGVSWYALDMGTNETPGVTVNGGTELPDGKQALAAAVQRLLTAEREYSAAFGELLTVAAADAGAGLWNAVCDGQEQYNELLKSVIRIRQAYRSEVKS
jgi:hypothetical protein